MKHLLLLLLLPTTLIITHSCSTVDFNNPLDPNGNNYLWGYDVPRNSELEREMVSDGENGSARLWTDPAFACDMRPPLINILGDDPAIVRYNTPNGEDVYKRLMGLLDGHWQGVITIDRGHRNTPVTAKAVLSTSRYAHDIYDYPGEELTPGVFYGEMPPRGSYYIIYTAQKTPCPNGIAPTAQAERRLIVE